MKLSTLAQLRCIQTHKHSVCNGSLELSTTPVTPRLNSAEDELIEGLLVCPQCAAHYPVICAVAILVRRLASWCRDNYHYIQSGAARNGGIGADLQDWLSAQQWHLGNHPADNYYETERWNAIFTDTHYGAVSTGDDDTSAIGQFIKAQPQVFEIVEQMIVRQLVGPVARALDVGCNVGGMALRLAAHVKQVTAIDTSFNSILSARKIQCGVPTAQTSYRRCIDGQHYEERTLKSAPTNNEFLLASIFDLPLAGHFDLVTALNVIDCVESPQQLLRSLADRVTDGGLLLLTSPYSWGSDDTPIDNWLGASAEQPSASATRAAITDLGFTILEEADDIPWVLREHQRWYRVFLNHCILAQKQVRA